MFIFYVLGSFILWELNPSMWKITDRGLLGFGGTLLSGVLSALIIETKENK
jgi:hypothetical protein|tara:strand:- start:21 stop:173 length:153 start_codon:yes stop_codon:yes gene_type:complete